MKNSKVSYLMDGLRSTLNAMGDPSRDKAAALHFEHKCIDDAELIAAYETNWMARNLVDIPAMDSLRKGWRWGDDKHETINDEETRLNVAGQIMRAFKKGRLLGGAALYIGTDQEPSEPLEIDRIPKGGVKFLNVITRLQLTAGEMDHDPDSEYFGEPGEYYINTVTRGRVSIHPSRLVVFNGDERADGMHIPSETGWPGISVIQSTVNAITDAQSSFSNTSSLIQEANIDVLGIPGLSDNINNDAYREGFLKRVQLFAQSKGINGMGVIDAEEELTRKSASFAQLPELMEGFAILVAAAGQIPSTRFLAQSPSGLVATGESDMKNYYDLISSKQKLEIDPAIAKLRQCIIRSAIGTSEPIPYTWEPLEQMSEQELSEIGKRTAETVKLMFDTGAITGEDARILLRYKLAENGSFPNIEGLLNEALGSLDPNADT